MQVFSLLHKCYKSYTYVSTAHEYADDNTTGNYTEYLKFCDLSTEIVS